MKRIEILTDAATARENEVLMHQINIDNYRLAIAEIEVNHSHEPPVLAFADRLRELLQASVIEQTKEKILLKVIRSQLPE